MSFYRKRTTIQSRIHIWMDHRTSETVVAEETELIALSFHFLIHIEQDYRFDTSR